MKRLLKILCLLLTAALLLAGCSSGVEETTETTQAVKSTTEATTEETTEATTEATTVPVTEPEETESVAEDGTAILGSYENGVYTNRYVGITYAVPENWTFQTAEELQALSETTMESLKQTQIGSALDGVSQLTVMMSVSEIGDNINIMLQYTEYNVLFATMSEEELVDLNLSQKDALISSFAQMGIDVTVIEKVTVNYLGQEHTALYTAGSIQAIPVHFLQIMDYSKGDYAIVITATSLLENNTQTMLDALQPIA